jgi:hypothetical protein
MTLFLVIKGAQSNAGCDAPFNRGKNGIILKTG